MKASDRRQSIFILQHGNFHSFQQKIACSAFAQTGGSAIPRPLPL